MKIIKYISLTLSSLMLLLAGCNRQRVAKSRPSELSNQTTSSMFHDFKLPALEGGQTIDFIKYKGKKVVILNVASKCGYTPQYADWQAFYEKNKDKVEVLGFPSNEFLGQEPGNGTEIAEFCQRNYGVSFQMFEKTTVKGGDKSPFYTWLSDKSKNGWNDQEPTWNFCKYLVNENGELTHFFSSVVKPDDAEFLAAIGK